jgi:Trk K+ transport system NAD-binding subunit
MRIFDPKLAERLDRGIELDITRSMSALAAPVFAAALLRRALAQPISLPNVALRVLETTLPDDSQHAGKPIQELQEPGELHVLAADGRWRPPHDLILRAGMAISVVATRSACDALLEQS